MEFGLETRSANPAAWLLRLKTLGSFRPVWPTGLAVRLSGYMNYLWSLAGSLEPYLIRHTQPALVVAFVCRSDCPVR